MFNQATTDNTNSGGTSTGTDATTGTDTSTGTDATAGTTGQTNTAGILPQVVPATGIFSIISHVFLRGQLGIQSLKHIVRKNFHSTFEFLLYIRVFIVHLRSNSTKMGSKCFRKCHNVSRKSGFSAQPRKSNISLPCYFGLL